MKAKTGNFPVKGPVPPMPEPPTGGPNVTPANPIEFDNLPLAEQARLNQIAKQQLEGEYIKQLTEEKARIRTENQIALKTAIDEMNKKLPPPTPEQIQTALCQDYVEVPIDIQHNGKPTRFTIIELPISTERKFYKTLTTRLQPKLSELSEFIGTRLFEGNLSDKLQAIMEIVDPAADTICELVALILNPKLGTLASMKLDGVEIDATWVDNTVPLWRCWNIVMAQVEVNRVRDFFSKAFRDSNQGTMITKA